ncbi:MAG: hypothetical protein PHX09_01560 [Clostridia bacterium]|nr:hypothetical protein [Clostridia bacterium]
MKKLKNIGYIFCLVIIALVFNVYNANLNNYVHAYNNLNFEVVNLTNKDFNNSPNSVNLDSNPYGWSKLKKSSSATSGIINVSENANKFSANCSKYQLEENQNPKTMSPTYDSRVLMINSKNSEGIVNSTIQGYSSNTISLEKYSFYEISVLVCTMDNAYASIYLNGFDNYATKQAVTVNDNFENIRTENNRWETYSFYIQTNFESISSKINLYLGQSSSKASTGVVFFDNISILKLTESKFASEVSSTTIKPEVNNIINMNINYVLEYASEDYNFNFETGTTADSWIKKGAFDSTNTIANVLNISTPEIMQGLNLNYLGTDTTLNNKYGLVLSTTEGCVGFASKDIAINQFGLYKISVNVKCDNINGNVYVKLVENDDILLMYPEYADDEFYNPTTNSLKLSSNLGDDLVNNYSTLSFYVSGHSLYDSSVKLELWLGADDDLSSGTVVFDNITVEKLNYNEFKSVSAGNTNKVIKLTTITSTPSIENGFFNSGINQDINTSFPIQAEQWTQSVKESSTSNVWGIVNTNEDKWNNNGFVLANPKNPTIKIGGTTITTPITDTNNILMIYNNIQSYQTITSPEFNTDSNSYYSFAFDFMAMNFISSGNSILNIYLQDNDGKILYEDFDVYSSAWENYSITIKTEHSSKKLKLILEVGSESEPAFGIVYLDNVTLTKQTLNEEDYTEIIQNKNNNVLDLSNLGLYVKGNEKNEFGIYDALLFNAELDIETQDTLAMGGIIDEENNFNINFPETNTNIVKNMLAISNLGVVTYSLTSKSDLKLTANSYYKFSVYIKTEFTEEVTEEADDDEDKKHNFGAEFTLNGLKDASMTSIKSNGFNEYVMYVLASKETTVQVKFAFTSDCYATTGNAFFDNFKFEEIDKEQYDNAVASDTELILAGTDTSEDNEEPKPVEENTGFGAEIWIGISTIIMTAAIILAVILSYLRKLDLKKYKAKKKIVTTYNRATTVSRDVVIKEAQNRRDAEIKLLNGDIKDLESYIENLEVDNKERIAKQRTEKKITKKSEREFKIYANARGKALKDIDKIKEKINNINSPEWLLQQEKLITAEKAKAKKTNNLIDTILKDKKDITKNETLKEKEVTLESETKTNKETETKNQKQ